MTYQTIPASDPAVRERLRPAVRVSLPEVDSILDDDLRQRTIEAWAYALSQTEFERIEDMPPGDPGEPLMIGLTMADHLRATATISVGMADGFEHVAGVTRIDRDLLVSAALCHDVGKPWEMSA